MFVEELKAVLYKIQVMTHVLTYVKVILLQYNPFLFSTIYPIFIDDLDYYADSGVSDNIDSESRYVVEECSFPQNRPLII